MNGDEEYERFDVDNDYEGGRWIDGEFLYSSKRQKRQKTRDDQLYGVFADDSEDEGTGRKKKKGYGGESVDKDYSRPVGFVSSGVVGGKREEAGDKQQPGKDKDTSRGSSGKDSSSKGSRAGASGSSNRGLGAAVDNDEIELEVGDAADSDAAGADDGDDSDQDRPMGLGLGARPTVQQPRSKQASGAGGKGVGGGGGGRAGIGGGGGLGIGTGKVDGGSGGGYGEEVADEDEGTAVLPTAFGRRIREKAAAAEAERARSKAAASTNAPSSHTFSHTSSRPHGSGSSLGNKADPGFASFERHTKGIGLKLLEKMGYKAGEGLGRNKQGIAKPVEARSRPKGAALGFGARDEVAPGSGFGAPAAPPLPVRDVAGTAGDGKAAAGVGGGVKAWKKKAAAVRGQRTYKTAEEVLEAAAEKPVAAAPILDLRGPHARVITNMENLNVAGEEQGTGVPMPELQHNLQLLVDMTEASLQRLDGALRQQQDTATLLSRDKSRLEGEVARGAQRLARATALLAQLGRCQAVLATTPLAQLAADYTALQKEFPEEYTIYNIAAAALAQVLPRLQAHLRGWSPLSEPNRGLSEFSSWRPLLEASGSSASASVLSSSLDAAAAEPYSLLVSELLLPPLRGSVLGNWEPRHPEPLLTFLDLWGPLLPPAATHQLLHMLVLPKLSAAVGSWDPRRETIPVHAWLHPWLEKLGSHMEGLYPTLRNKLEVALRDWHPSDGSAAALLGPWQRVFDAKDWEALTRKSITPKLAAALAGLEINPAAQVLEPFSWVMAWQELLPHAQMVALLEQAFFPRWHQVLHHWLSHGANFDEVTKWYLGWKSLLPLAIVDTPRIRTQLNYALNMMNSAVEGFALPPNEPPLPPTSAAPSGDYLSSAAAGVAGAGAASTLYPQHVVNMGGGVGAAPTLRDLVARYAEEHNVEFKPKPGRYQDGLQVYGFGSVSVVLENSQHAIRAQIRDRWAPVSLDMLLQQNVSKDAVAGSKSKGR